MEFVDDNEKEELLHYHEVIISFREYFLNLIPEIQRRLEHLLHGIEKLPIEIRELWRKSAHDDFCKMRRAIEMNQKFLDEVIYSKLQDNEEFIERELSSLHHGLTSDDENIVPGVEFYSNQNNMSKMNSVLHQVFREWSDGGKQEREVCFRPILKYLQQLVEIRENTKVLVPGCGLGRLVVEITSLGFNCQGNEFSYHMLFVSEFFLNVCKKSNTFSIVPWIDDPCNMLAKNDMIEEITVPDLTVQEIYRQKSSKSPGNMSMTAGEFLQVYDCTNPDFSNWNGIVTCFFLDTAPNVFVYIQRIYDLLNDNGVWINHGPLMWHWYSPLTKADLLQRRSMSAIDPRYNESIEINFDQIKQFILQVGFEMIAEERHEVGYCLNTRAMMHTVYKTVFFVCKKKSESTAR